MESPSKPGRFALLALDAVGVGPIPGSPAALGCSSLNDLFMAQRLLLRSLHWRSNRDTAFAKVEIRAASGPNVVSAAVGRDDDAASIAVGALGVLPQRLALAETRWHEGADAVEVARVAAAEVSLVDDVTATARYRRAVVATVVRRLVTDIEGYGWSRRRSTG